MDLASKISCGIDNVKYADKGGTDPWDQKKYLNIWVCNLALDVLGEQVPFVLGFAYPPVGAPLFPPGSLPEGYEVNDGVVIHYPVFGINNPGIGTLAGLNDKGRTCTHEVGHYLGLRHIWGDGDCTVDDGIADTPDADDSSQAEDPTITCESLFTKNTCSEIATQFPDMIENYMDYSKEECMNMFSQGQINMMRSMLEGPRAELVGLPASIGSVEKDGFVIFPNPTGNELNISYNSPVQYEIAILDVLGKAVFNGRSDVSKIDVSGLNNGVYFIQILGENQAFSTRFTIQK
ncbi:MAG: T9SS type A sorting domain-containing protein [Saprospiraceae bacterium]|nr:T9SS type A sorting domain-containing protein [Saprospiraceae bacterium]